MTDWLDELAPKLGIDATLSDEEMDALLKMARIAAHTSDDRRNAPLLTYLVGRSGRSPQDVLEDLQRSS
ncbi:MAG TPA: DUF6457 domain-containing protein [Gaiellaceae bacterium]|nr:DUF6457 domain-containing protein [Gaiellaceae bacterium]